MEGLIFKRSHRSDIKWRYPRYFNKPQKNTLIPSIPREKHKLKTKQKFS